MNLAGSEITLCSLFLRTETRSNHSASPVNLNHFLWMSRELKDFLMKRQSTKEGCDWDHLEKALKSPGLNKSRALLNLFSQKQSYQLRYRQHEECAIRFVENLLRNWSFLLHSKIVWGTAISPNVIDQLLHQFTTICSKARQEGIGKIYRLYDLCDLGNHTAFDAPSRTIDDFPQLLSLLYAFGEGDLDYKRVPNQQRVQSIDQLVERYHFFLHFFRSTVIQNSRQLSSARSHNDYFQTLEALKAAKKRWKEWQQTLQQSVLPKVIERLSNLFSEKKIDLTPYRRLSFEIPLRNYQTSHTRSLLSLEDNLKLLCDLLQRNGLNQHLSSPRPDQFEGRSTYTFRKNFLGVAYQIVVKCLSDQIACHLIRLPSVSVAKTLPHYTLSEYLKNAYDRYQMKDYNALHLVLGNVSADIDSIASALAFAYANLNDLDQLYLPLINIEREMLDWRKHVVYVFEKLNIDPDKILYKEEIGRIPKDNLKITLVDHNALSPCQEFLKSYVSEIIDHHSDNGKFPNVNKTLEKVGSNSTLIANKISNSTNYQISSDSAYLLLSAILLDTKNLQIEEDEEENKTTALDISINEKLQTICQEYNKVPHYEKLKEAFEDSLKSLFPFPHKLLEHDLKDEKAGYRNCSRVKIRARARVRILLPIIPETVYFFV